MSTALPAWHIKMPLIPCPWCGERDEVEFRYGGEAHISHADAATVDDATWADYLYMRNNPKGLFAERWVHQLGCRRWFNVLRDTVSHRIIAVYKIGEPPPPGSLPASSHGGDP
jgi:heterotetrameric sarcosine oxidase delta subunit